jgi:arsenate reductase (thioredoxin)
MTDRCRAGDYGSFTVRERKMRVIFLCCHNSVMSQMAEAFLREYGGTEFEVYSAGLQPREIDSLTIEVMEEVGIDLANHNSEPFRKYWGKMLYDYLVIMCKKADNECLFFPGVGHRLVWPFDDPGLNEIQQNRRIEAFRRTRDLIRKRIMEWIKDRETILQKDKSHKEVGSFDTPVRVLQ